MKKKLISALGGVLIALGAMQFFNPARLNPPEINDFISARPAAGAGGGHLARRVLRLPLQRHRLALVFALVAGFLADRLGCRSRTQPPESLRLAGGWASQAKQLDRINEVVDYREMPPRKYTLLHAAARLSEAQRQAVLDWTDAAAGKLRAATNN